MSFFQMLVIVLCLEYEESDTKKKKTEFIFSLGQNSLKGAILGRYYSVLVPYETSRF